jgi:hypothetical protein
MQKIFTKTLLTISLFFCFGFVVFAQGGLQYQMLSQEGTAGFANLKNPFPIDNGGNNTQQFLGTVFDLIIGISIALAVIIFMVGAFGNIFGDVKVGNIQANKEMMKNAVVGLIITLSFYLILQTINPDLVKFPLFNKLNLEAKGKAAGEANSSATNAQ